MAGYKYPYTLQDDLLILRYIIDGNYINVIKGASLWKKMETDQILPNRTWQSLKNRFNKTIIKDFCRPEYGLSPEELMSFRVRLSLPLSNNAQSSTCRRTADPGLVTRQDQKHVDNKPMSESRGKDKPPLQKDNEFYSLDVNSSASDND